jgi:chromate transporter
VAFLLQRFRPEVLATSKASAAKTQANEQGFYLNSESSVEGTGLNWQKSLLRFGLTLLLWALPLLAFFFFTREAAFWSTLILFFSKAALITFGGAYAVLPYVAQVTVEQLGWLSKYEMIDGLALGETTPGPLIMVLAFVGFMAGFHHYDGSLLMGALGLVTTTFYTFLPCFFFILAGAPFIERTRGNAAVASILGVVTAAVVGVILNLTVYFGMAVLFPREISWIGLDLFSLAWLLISVVAMYRFKIGMIPWIGVSALAGLGHYLLTVNL